MDRDSNILWVDFLANAVRLADRNEQEKLADHAKEAGITHLVISAKTPYGLTSYPSRFEPHIGDGADGRFVVWKGRDFLGELLEVLHSRGLKVIASMDTFVEGAHDNDDGLAHDKEDWKVVYYKPASSGLQPEFIATENRREESVFVNPIHEEVRLHELSIVKEIVENYDVDGFVLDRCRYPNVYGDFSDLSRKKFEAYINAKVERWPEDIFTADPKNGKEIVPGKLFGLWTEWRAMNIKSFVQQARAVVKTAKPDCLLCIYVGSWYPVYYSEGVNWGSITYQPYELDWVSENYHNAGYADELDFLMTGCYYPQVEKQEALDKGLKYWYSVEGGIEVSQQALNGQIPLFPSLYLLDYQGNPDQFARAVRMCKDRSQGVMLFDLIYIEIYGWWDRVKQLLI